MTCFELCCAKKWIGSRVSCNNSPEENPLETAYLAKWRSFWCLPQPSTAFISPVAAKISAWGPRFGTRVLPWRNGAKRCANCQAISSKRIRSTLWTLAPWNLIFNSSSAVGYWCVPAQIEAAACTSEPDTGTWGKSNFWRWQQAPAPPKKTSLSRFRWHWGTWMSFLGSKQRKFGKNPPCFRKSLQKLSKKTRREKQRSKKVISRRQVVKRRTKH